MKPWAAIGLFLALTVMMSSIFYAFIIASNATPWWFAVSCFAVLMLGMSVIMAWLRLTSGTLWTAALFHASHNQFIQVFFTPLTSSRGAITSYAIDEFGFALPATVLMIAVLFWKRSSGLDRVPARLTL
jgi:uncharacterized protein